MTHKTRLQRLEQLSDFVIMSRDATPDYARRLQIMRDTVTRAIAAVERGETLPQHDHTGNRAFIEIMQRLERLSLIVGAGNDAEH